MKFKLGDRVFIEGHWNFPNGCTGTISKPPKSSIEHMPDQKLRNGIKRTVKRKKGSIVFYWVKFDTPQTDTDGDGPYLEGEIEAEYIKPVDG
ncbi:MAG: hypothetical protein AB2728_16415 [Candidatus Thiodiazotropha sp.]